MTSSPATPPASGPDLRGRGGPVVQAAMLIGPERIPATSRDSFSSVDPYTGEGWADVAEATRDDVDRAIEAARRCFDHRWRRTPGLERGRLLWKLADLVDAHVDELAYLETRDAGKPISETRAQVGFLARNLRYFAGVADKLRGAAIPLDDANIFDYTVRRPYGVAALITAWNSPLSLLGNKLPPAVAAGNCVVVKPSELASVSTCRFADLVLDAGFPPGVINVLTGGADVGSALTTHPGVDKISVTGGMNTGRRVAGAAAQNLVPLTLELGGKSPNIVFADADLARAGTGAVSGIFAASGQSCVAGSRLLVEHSVVDTVLADIVRRTEAITVGDPLDPQTDMGPLANSSQFEAVRQVMTDAEKAGARPCAGGAGAVGDGTRGYFVPPTIYADVAPDDRIATDEIFGPVLVVLPFRDEAEAVRVANGTPFGLAAGVWTRDVARMHRMVDSLRAGVVWVNTYRRTSAQAPFGGVGLSGMGRERGLEALDDYLYPQNVMIDVSGHEARGNEDEM